MGRQLHSQDVSGPRNWVREGCTCLSSLCHPQSREGGSLRDPEQVPSLGPNQWGFMESSPQGDGEDKDHLPFSTRMMHLNPHPGPTRSSLAGGPLVQPDVTTDCRVWGSL